MMKFLITIICLTLLLTIPLQTKAIDHQPEANKNQNPYIREFEVGVKHTINWYIQDDNLQYYNVFLLNNETPKLVSTGNFTQIYTSIVEYKVNLTIQLQKGTYTFVLNATDFDGYTISLETLISTYSLTSSGTLPFSFISILAIPFLVLARKIVYRINNVRV